MFEIILQFVISALVIIAGGVALTRFTNTIAEITKLGRMIAGLFLLALATSLPELAVSLNAVNMDLYNVAAGGLFGSNLFNLLILGCLDLAFKSKRKMFSKISSIHALSAVSSITLMALPAIAIMSNSKYVIGNIGIGSVGIFLAYGFGIRLIYFDQNIVLKAQEKSSKKPDLDKEEKVRLAKAITGYVLSAIVIFLAAPYISESAGDIAKITGISGTFIGTTLVALSTSLPELVTTVAAIRIGSFDMAVGNIFGSNSFNMVLIGITDLFSANSFLGTISPIHAITCVAAIFITAIVVLAQLYQAEKRVILIEPDALLVIILVLSTLGLIYYL